MATWLLRSLAILLGTQAALASGVSALDEEVELSVSEAEVTKLVTTSRAARDPKATVATRDEAEAALLALSKTIRKDLKNTDIPADAPVRWRASPKVIEFFFRVAEKGEPPAVTVHAVRLYLALTRDEELQGFSTRHARLTLPLASLAELFDKLEKADPTWAGAGTAKSDLFQADKLGKQATALVTPWLASVVAELKDAGVEKKTRFEARIQGKELVLLLFTNGATDKIPTVELSLAPVREKVIVRWFLFRTTAYSRP